jgi:hypothetical protein
VACGRITVIRRIVSGTHPKAPLLHLSGWYADRRGQRGSGGPWLERSTFLGGSLSDSGRALSLHPTGSPVVGGTTTSPDLPVTANTIQPAFGGVLDGFITWLNRDLTGLIFSTYLGGSAADALVALDVHANPDIIVGGSTNSLNFPVRNPFQSTMAGIQDGFVTRLTTAFQVPRTPPLFVGGLCPPPPCR